MGKWPEIIRGSVPMGRYIGEQNWCYGALSTRLKLTKLLDFGLWDISLIGLAKWNEDI